ncbi:MAG: hypothetical protein LBH24_06680, partial [Clostridiales bacterium]|nr:hypothetical protein [Clostridiales bacterium]
EIAALRIRYRLTDITAPGVATFQPRFYFNGAAWDAPANGGGVTITAAVGQDMADYETLVITQADLLTKYSYLTPEAALSQLGLLGPQVGGNDNTAAMHLDSITVLTRAGQQAARSELLKFSSTDALAIVSGGLLDADAAAIEVDYHAEDGYALTKSFGHSGGAFPLVVQLGSVWTVGEIEALRIRYRLTDIAAGSAAVTYFWPRFYFNGTAWDDTSQNGNGGGVTITATVGQDMADYATLVITQAELLEKYPYLTAETALSQLGLLGPLNGDGGRNTATLHLDSITVLTR